MESRQKIKAFLNLDTIKIEISDLLPQNYIK